MTQSHLFKIWSYLKIPQQLSLIVIVGTLLPLVVQNSVDAARLIPVNPPSNLRQDFFVLPISFPDLVLGDPIFGPIPITEKPATTAESGQVPNSALGPIQISSVDTTIKGSLLHSADINLYQLQLSFDATLTINAQRGMGSMFGDNQTPLFLFDAMGRGLKTGTQLSVNGVAEEIFYLGIGGTIALNENGQTILDPSKPSFVGPGKLTSWVDRGFALMVLYPYEISITATPVPEPMTAVGAGAVVGLGTIFKRRLNQNRFNQK